MRTCLLTAGLLTLFLTGCVFRDNGSFQTQTVLKMADSTAQYDLWLTVRVSPDDAEGPLPVFIKAESPDGIYTARDTFEIPLKKERIKDCGSDGMRCRCSALSYDVECLYRKGVSPVICGEWSVTMESDGKRVRGLWIRAETKSRF